MPELPEVESVVRRVRQGAPWAEITATGQFRLTTMTGGEQAIGRRILAVDRRGKNILVRLAGDAFLRIHLKMTGNLVILPDYRLRPATVRAWFALADSRCLALDDPRALGRISFHADNEELALFEALGPEPFDPRFTTEFFADAAKQTTKPIKPWLLEQRAVAGLGNIYAAEALFAAGIHPARPACRISRPKLFNLHAAIVQVLRVALDSAVASYAQPGGFSEGEDFPIAVYGRLGELCFRCQTAIGRIRQGGRSTYYCPRCQK